MDAEWLTNPNQLMLLGEDETDLHTARVPHRRYPRRAKSAPTDADLAAELWAYENVQPFLSRLALRNDCRAYLKTKQSNNRTATDTQWSDLRGSLKNSRARASTSA